MIPVINLQFSENESLDTKSIINFKTSIVHLREIKVLDLTQKDTTLFLSIFNLIIFKTQGE
jgi:hypothetical protein